MNRTILLTGLTSLVIGTTANAVASPDLIKNGSFENGVNPPTTFSPVGQDGVSIDNWDTSGYVEWTNRLYDPSFAYDGNLAVHLYRLPGAASSISQTFATSANEHIAGTFFAFTPMFTSLLVSFESVGGTYFKYRNIFIYNDPNQYSAYSFDFIAPNYATLSKLTFYATQTASSVFIDKVSVTQVNPSTPSPAAALPFLIGLLRKRRTKKS